MYDGWCWLFDDDPAPTSCLNDPSDESRSLKLNGVVPLHCRELMWPLGLLVCASLPFGWLMTVAQGLRLVLSSFGTPSDLVVTSAPSLPWTDGPTILQWLHTWNSQWGHGGHRLMICFLGWPMNWSRAQWARTEEWLFESTLMRSTAFLVDGSGWTDFSHFVPTRQVNSTCMLHIIKYIIILYYSHSHTHTYIYIHIIIVYCIIWIYIYMCLFIYLLIFSLFVSQENYIHI